MRRAELADTLLQLVGGVEAPPGSGLVVTEALLEIPLEVGSAVRGSELVFLGAPPHTRFRAGVLPPVHHSRLRIGPAEEGSDG